MVREKHGSVSYETVSDDYFRKRALRRHARVWSLWALGVGAVISGNFFGWNTGLDAGGFGGMFVAAIIITVMYFGLCYSIAEMTSALPHAGGAYSFCRSAMGPWAGLIAGVGQNIQYIIMPAAIVVGIGGYFEAIFGTPPDFAPVWWLVCYAVFVGLNVWGAAISFRIAVAVTLAALVILFAFYIGAIQHFDVEYLKIQPAEVGGSPWFPHGWRGIADALPFALWLYLAIEMLPLAAEESRNPERNVPKGLMLGLLTLVITGFLIMFLNAGIAPGAAEVGASGEPLYLGLKTVFGDMMGNKVWAGIAVVGLIASFHAIVFAYSRNIFSLSRAGYLPKWMSATHHTRATPHVALLVGAAVGYIVALIVHFAKDLFGNVSEGVVLVYMVVFGASISYAMQCLAFIQLRKKLPYIDRPYFSPVGASGAWIALVILVVTLVLLLRNPDFQVGLWGMAIWYGIVLLYFALYSRHRLVTSPEEEFAITEYMNSEEEYYPDDDE